jgi:putative PIN family toxin of toxin-antitoxin system
VFSPATFDELRSRLWKPKFDRWLSIEQRKALLHDISACALAVDVPSELADRRFSRDRSDDAFIHATLAGHARWLVTGDQDLLTVTEPLPLALLTPATALADPDFLAAAET